MFKQIYGLSDRQYQENKEYFVELFGVKELMDVQVRTLSLRKDENGTDSSFIRTIPESFSWMSLP